MLSSVKGLFHSLFCSIGVWLNCNILNAILFLFFQGKTNGSLVPQYDFELAKLQQRLQLLLSKIKKLRGQIYLFCTCLSLCLSEMELKRDPGQTI